MHRTKSVHPTAMRAGGWIALFAFLFTVSAKAIQAPAKTPSKAAQSQTTRRAPAAGKKPATAKADPDFSWFEDFLKNPDLMNEVNHLSERLAKEMQYPALRTQSTILPRLSQDTTFYVSLPNFGPQLRQALEIYRQELHDSAALRDFLQKNHLNASEPKVEDGVSKFSEFLDYLGDELVITGGLHGKQPTGVLIAEVKKPGLRDFLEKINQEMSSKPAGSIRVFDPQQLQTATENPGDAPAVLIRSDFVLISTPANLRDFNAQLDKGGSSFASTQFGKRLTQSYQAGTHTVVGLDTQRLMALIPENSPQTSAILEKTGLADVKYAVMDSQIANGQATTHMEVAFSGPRHGVPSWIAMPAQLGALDFMSPKSSVAEAVRLKNPAQIFDDIAEIAGPGAFAMLPQMEAQLNVNLKQDILSKLTGEIGFEMQEPMVPAMGTKPQQPNFTLILGVSDAAGLQQTMKHLLTQAPVQSGERQEDGVTFYTLTTPSPNGQAAELNYFFMDGYMVVGTNRELAQQALHAHRSGESLAKSSQVTAAAGQAVKASALVYQNSGTMIASILKQLPAEMLSQFPKNLLAGDSKPTVLVATADETSIRATTGANPTTGAGVALVIAAIAIPNLMHARIPANESAAVATVRVVNTAQVVYKTNYPQKGYAPNLSAMGPGVNDCPGSKGTAAHACLLDGVVGNNSCIAGKWCEKSGYRYSVRGICTQTSCRAYVVTATPISENTGGKSFCSATDAVIRSHTGPPLTAPLTAAECKTWAPIH